VTSVQYAFRSTGSTLGTSLASLLFQWNLGHFLKTRLFQHAPENVSKEETLYIIDKALHSATYIHSAPEWAVATLVNGYNVGCWSTFLYALVASLFGFLSILAVREYKLHSTVSRK
ncbi:hypothetical protein WICPIJ_006399, partial [Wickerhamomyces pijperi]